MREILASDAPLPTATVTIAVGVPADTVRQRPDVRAAERTLAAETARVGVAEAARYPSFQLSGSIGVEALTESALGDRSGSFYSIVAGVTAPIFNAGRLSAEADSQDAVREQAAATYRTTVLNALQEVEGALAGIVRSREHFDALSRATDAAREAADLARQRYEAGVIDFQSVLDTQRTVRSLEDSLATTESDGVLSVVQLYKALGGGWSPVAEEEANGEDAR